MTSSRKVGLLRFIGPGLLVAATGVGAGDLATGAFSGSVLGTVVLWPLLAVVLLVLNGRAAWVGQENRNGPVTILLLAATLAFFVYAGWLELARKFGG